MKSLKHFFSLFILMGMLKAEGETTEVDLLEAKVSSKVSALHLMNPDLYSEVPGNSKVILRVKGNNPWRYQLSALRKGCEKITKLSVAKAVKGFSKKEKKLLTQIKKLKASLTQLQSDYDGAIVFTKKQAALIVEFNEKVYDLNKELAKVKNELSTCKATNQEFSLKIQSLESSLENVNKKLMQKLELVEAQGVLITKFNAKVYQLEKELADIKQELNNSETVNKTLINKVLEVEKIAEATKKELETSVKQIEAQNILIVEFNEKVYDLEKALSEAKKDLENCKIDNEGLIVKITELESSSAALQQELAVKADLVNKQSQLIVEFNEKVYDLEKALAEAKNNLEACQVDHQALTAKVSELEATAAELEQKLAIKTNLAEGQAALIVEFNEKIYDLEKELARINKELEVSNISLMELEQVKIDLQVTVSNLESAKIALQNEHEETLEALFQAEKNITVVQQEVVVLQEDNEVLEQEILEFQQIATDLEGVNTGLIAEKTTLIEQAAVLQSQLEVKTTEFETLQIAYNELLAQQNN